MTAQGASRSDLNRAAAVHPSDEICELYNQLADIRSALGDVARVAKQLSRKEMALRAELGMTTAAVPEDLFRGEV